VQPLQENLIKQISIIRDFEVAHLVQSTNHYLETLQDLYQQLILPIRESLVEKSRLVIIPHGILNNLPFEILTSSSEETDFRKQAYLLRDFSVQYAWSAALWTKDFSWSEKAAYTYVGFAPSYQTHTFAEVSPTYRAGLSELTYSIPEVKKADEYFNGEVFLNTNATESAFRTYAPKSRIIHLATHAFMDDKNPSHSGLAFSHDTDTLSDGFLHAYEVYHLHLPAELAVMSACNTGAGQIAEGEGIISLGRAFLYAGCRSIMVSQWLANDQSSSKLMSYFYHQLSEGKNKDEALRLAKLDYLAQADALTAHPYFWAGMVVVGDMEKVEVNGFSWFWMVGLLVVLGILLFISRQSFYIK
jgi:CHAT domain-containing protein